MERDVTVGMVLDYLAHSDSEPLRVRVKGFRSAHKNRFNYDQGLVYLVPVTGRQIQQVPSELRDLPVSTFWQLVEDGQLLVVDDPAG